MKEINAGSGKRMTGSLTRLSRKIQSTQERNRHDQVGWSRAVTQGRSPVRINRLYEKLSRLIITDIHLLLCSHDLKTWSESESRYHVRKWEKQYMSYFSHTQKMQLQLTIYGKLCLSGLTGRTFSLKCHGMTQSCKARKVLAAP